MGRIGIKTQLIRASPGGLTYSTSFPATENPISEGGRWSNGGVVATDWQNVRTTPGKAFGGVTAAGYDDSIAILSGFPANQRAQATVFRQVGYTPPDTHEVELLLRFQLGPSFARGYEMDFAFGGTILQIMRWNGTIGDFIPVDYTGPGPSGLVTGDVITADMIGNVITVYTNGSLIATATDNTFADGNPGQGFFPRPGATPENYCFSQFTAMGL